jgi:hypothetical protein
MKMTFIMNLARSLTSGLKHYISHSLSAVAFKLRSSGVPLATIRGFASTLSFIIKVVSMNFVTHNCFIFFLPRFEHNRGLSPF